MVSSQKVQWLVCVLAISCMALAQTSSDKEEEKKAKDPEVHESVTVWGTKVKTSSVQVDERSLAIKQADHISDLLRTIPGVDVGGAHSLNQRITIRSMDDKDLRITIDGANQNTYMYHHMGNLQIHADILKSVDISVGKNSVLNGSLGGSVQFETKDAKDLLSENENLGARLQTAYGDNASSGFSLTGFGKLAGKFDFLAYFNRTHRDNYEVGGGEIKDENGDLFPGTDGAVRGHEGDLNNGLIKFGWDLNPQNRFEIAFETYDDSGDFSYRPDMGLATDITISERLNLPLVYPTEFTRDTATLNYEGSLSKDFDFRATAFFNQSDLWRDESGVAAVFGSASIVEGRAENQGIKVRGQNTWGESVRHTLIFGSEYIDHETRYRNDGVQLSGETSDHTAFYIEDQIQITDAFRVVPGLRYDRYSLESKVVDQTFSDVSGGLALHYQLNEDMDLRVSGTQLFKGPEIGEVFIGAGLRDAPNPKIEAETGLNIEVGFAYSNAVLGADRFSFGLTGFQTQIDNYIYDYARAPEVRFWKDNVGDMDIDGFEGYLGYDLGPFRSLFTASIAESDLKAFDAYEFYNGARLDRTQGDTFSLDLSYEFYAEQLELKWTSLAVGDVGAGLDLDGASLNNAKDDYQIHNISMRWTPPALRGLAVNLGIDNLFDEYFASQSSRTGVSAHPFFGNLYLLDYEPGRNIKATVSFQF